MSNEKNYFELPYTHEELMILLDKISDLESSEGIQGPQGERGPAGPQGIQGPKGDKGEQGPAGKDADVTALQQEIAELQSTINELTQVPEIVIANKNIESEMEYLNERTKDENVIGIIIDPYVLPTGSYGWSNIFSSPFPYFDIYSTIEFINNNIIHSNKIEETRINEFKKIKIEMREKESQDLKWAYSGVYHINKKNINIEEEINYDFKTLLQQVYDGKTELEMNYLLQIEVMPNFKKVELLYSTILTLK